MKRTHFSDCKGEQELAVAAPFLLPFIHKIKQYLGSVSAPYTAA